MYSCVQITIFIFHTLTRFRKLLIFCCLFLYLIISSIYFPWSVSLSILPETSVEGFFIIQFILNPWPLKCALKFTLFSLFIYVLILVYLCFLYLVENLILSYGYQEGVWVEGRGQWCYFSIYLTLLIFFLKFFFWNSLFSLSFSLILSLSLLSLSLSLSRSLSLSLLPPLFMFKELARHIIDHINFGCFYALSTGYHSGSFIPPLKILNKLWK